MTREEYAAYIHSPKFQKIAAERFKIDGYRCCMCGCRGTATNKLECHHLSYKYLGHEEQRIYQDLCTLCHCCHKSVHKLMERQTDPSGRKGWLDNSRIPDIHVYTFGGEDTHIKEGNT